MAQPVIPGTSGTPMSWVPSTTPRNLVAGASSPLAGDWIQVIVAYPAGTPSVPVLTPGYFLFHVLVTPSSDDSFSMREDQATIYGGDATNQRSVYRVDPGLWFQVPFNCQLAIVAGGDAPADCVLQVIVKRGHTPRHPPASAPNPYGISCNPTAGPHVWAPPVVGTPQEVFATWLNVPPLTAIDWPAGAIGMVAVDASAIPANPIQMESVTCGVNVQFALASGIRAPVAALAQGGGQTASVPAQWAARAPPGGLLTNVTIYQSFGG